MNQQQPSNSRRLPGFSFAVFGCGLAVVVIVLGAFTRLVDAGLGCPDWPVCYGHILWPIDEQEVAAANSAFPDTPVEHDKTWPEQVHRLAASSLGLVCIGIVIASLRHRRVNPSQPLVLPFFLLALVIVQGLFGMWTVTLKLWPQVVTAHLLGGFSTLACLYLLALRLHNQHWQLPAAQLAGLARLRPLLLLSLFVVVIQIALGGWTTSNYAALACPDLPTCQTHWIPPMDFRAGFDFMQDIGPNYLGGVMDSDARTAIHFSHRVGAVVVLLVVSLLVFALRAQPIAAAQTWARALLAILLLQIALGLSNVYWSLPLPIAVAHNAVGAALLLAIVGLCHRLFTARATSDNSQSSGQ